MLACLLACLLVCLFVCLFVFWLWLVGCCSVIRCICKLQSLILTGFIASHGTFQTEFILLPHWYCWWKKSCTSWYVVYPSGAGFLPSTVVPHEIFDISGDNTPPPTLEDGPPGIVSGKDSTPTKKAIKKWPFGGRGPTTRFLADLRTSYAYSPLTNSDDPASVKMNGLGWGDPLLSSEKRAGGWLGYMDVSKNRGTPKWMVYIIIESPIKVKWMIWGYPYFWKHPYIGDDVLPSFVENIS